MFLVFTYGWLPDADHGTPVGTSPSSASYGYDGKECCAWCQQQFPSSNINYVDYRKGQECRCWALTGTPKKAGKANWLWGACSAPAGRRKRSAGNTTVSVAPVERRVARETGLETELELAMRSYGSVLRYQCGPARKFYDPELDELYPERNMTCNWNATWTTRDYVDECVWTQCLYPPEPPGNTLLLSTWGGDPVEFYDNVSYVCPEGLYFEWDREMPEYNLTCQTDGSWIEPPVWPICLPCNNQPSSQPLSI